MISCCSNNIRNIFKYIIFFTNFDFTNFTVDENRNEGKFYLEYSVRRSLLDRRPDITSVEIIVKELSSKECLISTSLDVENLDLSEEIISQINQSLS